MILALFLTPQSTRLDHFLKSSNLLVINLPCEDNKKKQPNSCYLQENKMRQHVNALVGQAVLKFDTVIAKLKYSSSPSDNLIVEEAVQELNSFLAQENMRLQELTDLLQEKHHTMSQEVLDQKDLTLENLFFILKSMQDRRKQPALRNENLGKVKERKSLNISPCLCLFKQTFQNLSLQEEIPSYRVLQKNAPNP